MRVWVCGHNNYKHEARGKYFVIRRWKNDTFEIRPVDDIVEFRRWVGNRGGARTAEDVDVAMKQRSKSSRLNTFLAKGSSSKQTLREVHEKNVGQLGFQGVDRGVDDNGNDAGVKPKKKKSTKVATLGKVDPESVDVEEVDWEAEIEFAADDEQVLGGVHGVDYNVPYQSDGSSDDEEELVDIGGNAIIARARTGIEAEEEEDFLNAEDGEDEGDDDDEDRYKDDFKEFERSPNEAAADATATEGSAAVRKADSQPDAARPNKRQAVVGAAGAPVPSSDRLNARKAAVEKDRATRAEVRADLVKYLTRASLTGMTIKELNKKLSKKPYMKTNRKVAQECLIKAMKELAERQKIEGEFRFILKTQP